MLSSPRSAVYKCPILIEKTFTKSTVAYGSPLYLSQNEAPFFMAWPELGADPVQPCCLPTLLRARYFFNRHTYIELETVIKTAEKYVSSQESIESKVKEVALAIIKYHQTLWRFSPKFTEQPPILFGVDRLPNIKGEEFSILKINKPEDFISLQPAQELAIQGLIYGNLAYIDKGRKKKNLFGVKEAFSLAHEAAHDLARVSHCGDVLEELSREAHSILFSFTKNSFSPEQVTEKWSEFSAINDRIYRFSEKFEPIEEIFANYVGLRLLPINIKNEVESLVKNHLIEKKWDEAYNAFTESSRSHPPALTSL